ncbi:enhancer of filamentation 1 [Pelobates cultripes]|uniref:Breast cancer anti-estrogen resistance protein 1 n=2 Tax=Pelobates cultripes TaxID=61616 RepID=A0AAD1W515_PELCU|nr:enhancer of filamentation 1 [Pelobates cultripes]
MKYKNLMARALYDNVPECAEELSFRKGDILTVIEQNTGGLEGWWLCSLHGRQGIAPGNRLKLLIGPVSDSSKHDISKQEIPLQPCFQQQIYQVPHPSYQDPVYQVPPSHHNQGVCKPLGGHGLEDTSQFGDSIDGSPGNKGITQNRMGWECSPRWQGNVYDILPTRPQGVYDVPPAMKSLNYSSPARETSLQDIYDVPSSQGIYNTLPSTMEKIYDFPSPLNQKAEPTYDTLPPSSKTVCQEQCRKPNGVCLSPAESVLRKHSLYDFPRSQQSAQQSDDYDFPRSIQSSAESEGFASDDHDGVYDFPPHTLHDSKVLHDVTDGVNRLSFSSTGSTRSNMSTSSTTSKESSITSSPSQDKRLLLDPDTAIEVLLKLQQTVEASVNRLATFVNTDWRSYAYMEKHINEIHATVDGVEQSLNEYLKFARGATSNASCLSESGLYNKMKREFQRLGDSHQILTQTSQELCNCNWSLNVLAFNKANSKCDSLERFVMVARTIIDDAKQLTTSISVNAELLFKQATIGFYKKRPSETIGTVPDYLYNITKTPVSQDDHVLTPGHPFPHTIKDQPPNYKGRDGSLRSWMDDYDYVHLQGKEEFERHQRELLEKENIIKHSKPQLEQQQLSQFQQLEKEITTPVENDISKWKSPQSVPAESSTLAPQDKQLLYFYSEQCEALFISLLNAIDAFFNCMSTAQPPRIFVAHSKFVILSAHKLVFIGDTLSRQVVTQEICNRLMNSSNQLCELLKNIVMATKMAALNYPSSGSLQEMVDRVTELSSQAQLFKLSLAQMAAL